MSTYAIGDLQGCFQPLLQLLEKIQFDEAKDTLWFTGDLVNRGPQSLECLRFIKNLGNKAKLILGNHDLHLLAVAHGTHQGLKGDTFDEILQAKDRVELLNWLQHQPLLYHDSQLGYTLVHAGLAPSWDLVTAQNLAREVEQVLQGDQALIFFQHMYANHPDHWESKLSGVDRWRCITNFFTRLRFCYPDGRMDFSSKGKMNSSELIPWFNIPNRVNANLKIIFGHWAALGGVTHQPNAYAIDTGCVWGYALTAMRLEDEMRFCVNCKS